jgi:Virulence-associated protein E
MTDSAELAGLIEPLARHFFGEPNRQQSSKIELRFGSHGSKSIDLKKGTWFDHEDGLGGGVLDLIERMTGLHGQERFEWLESNGFLAPRAAKYDPPPPRNKIEKIYNYRDENGHILFQVVRLHPKTFRQRRPDPDLPHEWRWNVQGIRQAPYRLPEVLEAIKAQRVVYVVEGEKDVDRLWEIGVPATTNAGGAGKWRADFTPYFAGADVVVIPDNDPQKHSPTTGEPEFHADGRPKLPGQDHARAVCNFLAGAAKRVRYLDLAQHWEAPEKGDVSDWLDGGGSAEALAALAERAPQWLRVASSRGRERRREPPVERPPWYAELRRDDRGHVFSDLRNVLIALRAAPELAEAFRFDELAQRPVLARAVPPAPGGALALPPPRPVDEEDVGRTQEWLQHSGLPRVGRETVDQAIDLRARERRFHPLREWLERLEWDGQPRLSGWLHSYLGTPDDEYHRQIGGMFLIAMVARIFEPGCQSDYMLVLEGPQGEEKSRLCRALAGEYFGDHMPPIDDDPVRLSMYLRGKWLVEIAELSAFSKADAAALKSFISRRIEEYTPKYARTQVIEPRQCLFIGTTNDDDYVKDDSGGRRYWPVKVVAVDLAGFIEVREQLFAEAMAAYQEGKPCWPDKQFEAQFIAPKQEERQFEDAWAEKINDIIASLRHITIAQVGSLMGIEATRFGPAEQRRVAAILRKAKWKRERDPETRRMVWKPAV